MNRSTDAFCHGEHGAVTTVWICMAARAQRKGQGGAGQV
jgi:hypothetical protein